MWDQAQIELAIEYDSAYDDHHERYAGERLDPEYEAYCDEMNAWDSSWPLYPMESNEMANNEYDMADAIAGMSFNDKMVALVNECGYSYKQAVEFLEEMGE